MTILPRKNLFPLVLVVVAIFTPRPAAQRVLRDSLQNLSPIENYVELVLQYRAGEHDVATAEIARWSPDDLHRVLERLPSLLANMAASGELKKRGITRRVIVASAMTVHIDIARRAETAEEIDRHLLVGRQLSDLLPPDEGGPFRAQWHLVAGTIMLSLSSLPEAVRHFQIAQELNPRDPEILLALGSVHELVGSLPAQRKPPDQPLKEAIGLYRAALEAAPDLHEARLRLARTYSLLRDFQTAAVEIARIESVNSEPHLRYLTVLIGGSIAEAGGGSDQAVARYRQARALCKGCQSATLALSQSLLRSGDRRSAHELVDVLVNEPTWPPPADPWWVYQRGQWHSIDGMLEQLRQETPK